MDVEKSAAEIRERIAKAAEGLEFVPESHEYFFRGRPLVSVSDVCKQFARPFDKAGKAAELAEKRGVPAELILKEWDENSARACAAGTKTHAYAEWKFYREMNLPVPADLEFSGNRETVPDFRSVDAVWEFLKTDFGRVKYVPAAAEPRVMNLELGYAGTIDLVALEIFDSGKTGLVIFDYKTNENLFDYFRNETMLPPMDDTLDCSAGHYACQLSLYQLALQKIFPEMPVSRRVLFWLNPDGVELIRENSRERFENSGKKWKWLREFEIGKLKKNYNFQSQKMFGTLKLPDVSARLCDFLAGTRSGNA